MNNLFGQVINSSSTHPRFHITYKIFAQMDNVIAFIKDSKIELSVIGISTLLFHAARLLHKDKNESVSELKNQFIEVRAQKFDEIDKKHVNNIPREILENENSLTDQVRYLYGKTSNIHYVPHLIAELQLRHLPTIHSPLLLDKQGNGLLDASSFVYKGSYVLSKNVYCSTQELSKPVEWLLAGPRKCLYFQPSKVKAAIVTCGGLCPGLNVVIREIYINLNMHYGCSQIWGINYGYQGIYSPAPWTRLDLSEIKNLQFQGGTTLGSSRGGFDNKKMIDALTVRGINQLYVIGGDGTHRGIHILHQEIKNKGLEISVIGVPKTIDNDIPFIDKSFGFETAVSESIRAIRSAYVESRGVSHGIGLVRLMGRDAGFIAMEAANASRDVDLCLIPEAQFNLYGEFGVLEYVYQQLKEKEHLVIVVAEGAGSGVLDLKELGEKVEKDESGNAKLSDIGAFLKDQIVSYCKKKNLNATLKYIDPTYMIRTVPANSHDVRMCSELAAAAVHGAMAGFTGFTVGHVNNTPSMIPVSALFGKKNKVDLGSRTWQRVLSGTGQPEFK